MLAGSRWFSKKKLRTSVIASYLSRLFFIHNRLVQHAVDCSEIVVVDATNTKPPEPGSRFSGSHDRWVSPVTVALLPGRARTPFSRSFVDAEKWYRIRMDQEGCMCCCSCRDFEVHHLLCMHIFLVARFRNVPSIRYTPGNFRYKVVISKKLDSKVE